MLALVSVALETINEVMKKLPDYDDRKREQYFRLIRDLKNEMLSTDRDDLRVDELSDKLQQFLEVFRSELR